VETRDLNDQVRQSFGLYPKGDPQYGRLLHACLGYAVESTPSQTAEGNSSPPKVMPTAVPGNPYKVNSPCWLWYNEHPQDKNSCKDEENNR
jgi:hypothetical protein